MKPAPFDYYTPSTTEEALNLLAEHGFDGKVLAGGQSLIPTMNFRLSQPSVLIDINGIDELAYIDAAADGGLKIGAMTRHRTVEQDQLVAQRAPLVQATMPYVAHSQIRNRGTFGGSIAHADPAAELPALSLVLEGRFKLRGPNGERWVAAKDFFIDLFTTSLEPEDLLVEVALPPMPARSGWGFREISRRRGDFALVGVAAMVVLDVQGLCQDARLALFSVGPGPVAAEKAAAQLKGEALTPQAIEAAAETAASADIEPSSDIHASAEFRCHLARVLVRQTLTQAVENARKKGS